MNPIFRRVKIPRNPSPYHTVFGPVQPFDLVHVGQVHPRPGVYIIYDLARPIYVGRSRVDIYARLRAHVSGYGSRLVADALRVGAASSLTFEYRHVVSVEQAESQLIAVLGTSLLANLRREADPADR